MSLANVSSIAMTSAVFDDNERQRWLNGFQPDSRFTGVLRFDQLLLDWQSAGKKLAAWGYQVGPVDKMGRGVHIEALRTPGPTTNREARKEPPPVGMTAESV